MAQKTGGVVFDSRDYFGNALPPCSGRTLRKEVRSWSCDVLVLVSPGALVVVVVMVVTAVAVLLHCWGVCAGIIFGVRTKNLLCAQP